MKNNIKIKSYENGSRIIVEKNKNAKYIAFSLNIFAGSGNDAYNAYGCAHFLEHMFFKGTKTRSEEQIAKDFENNGIFFNASTGRWQTYFHFRCIKESLEKGMEIYADMLFNSKFNKDDFEKEKSVIQEEFSRKIDLPNYVSLLADNAHWSRYIPNVHMTLGTKESIANMKIQDLKNFIKKYYIGKNIIFSFCGNISLKEATKLTEKYFSSFLKNDSKNYKENKFNITPQDPFIVKDYDISQLKVYINFKSLKAYDENRYVATVYKNILGNGASSRLHTEVRQNNALVYSIVASRSYDICCGVLTISFGTSPEKLEKALCGIQKVLKDMADNGITQEELDKDKLLIKTANAISEDSMLSSAIGNAENIYYKNRTYSDKDFMDAINNVTIEQVNHFAKEIYNEKEMTIGIAGKNLNKTELKALFKKYGFVSKK